MPRLTRRELLARLARIVKVSSVGCLALLLGCGAAAVWARSGGKIAAGGSSAAGARDSNHPDGTAENCQPPPVARHACPGHWRPDSAFLLLPRARRDSED